MQNLSELLALAIPYILTGFGVILIIYGIFKKSKEENLKSNGLYADGVIFEQPDSSDDLSDASSKIIVRFTTKKMLWITTSVKNDFTAFYTGQYKAGDQVKILYNPDDPAECVIITRQSEKTVRVIMICLGFVFCIIGLIKLFGKN